eukprot:189478-Amphidinium_carterae.1
MVSLGWLGEGREGVGSQACDFTSLHLLLAAQVHSVMEHRTMEDKPAIRNELVTGTAQVFDATPTKTRRGRSKTGGKIQL